MRTYGLAKPSGTVRVTVGWKKYSAKLSRSAKGYVSVVTHELLRGKHKLTLRYTPDAKAKKYVVKATKKVTVRKR